MHSSGPLTIADVRDDGVALLVWCRCGHRAEVDPATIQLRPSTPIPKIEDKFRSAACGAKNTAIDHLIMALMDPRPGQRICPE